LRGFKTGEGKDTKVNDFKSQQKKKERNFTGGGFSGRRGFTSIYVKRRKDYKKEEKKAASITLLNPKIKEVILHHSEVIKNN